MTEPRSERRRPFHHRDHGRARPGGAADLRGLRPAPRRRRGRRGRVGDRRARPRPGAGRARGTRHRARQRRGQGGQEPAQDARHPARPRRCPVGRGHRRAARARHHRVRQADGRRRGGLPVDQPVGHAGQQDADGAQGPQRRDHLPVAQGRLDRRAAGVVHPRAARQGRRTARPGADHRRAHEGADVRADGPGRLRRRHRIAEERAGRLQLGHAGHRRRGRQRAGDRRRDRRPGRRGGEGPAEQDLRLRHQLLVGELPARARQRLRPDARRVAGRGCVPAQRRRRSVGCRRRCGPTAG